MENLDADVKGKPIKSWRYESTRVYEVSWLSLALLNIWFEKSSCSSPHDARSALISGFYWVNLKQKIWKPRMVPIIFFCTYSVQHYTKIVALVKFYITRIRAFSNMH